jgi:hypothetical protein
MIPPDDAALRLRELASDVFPTFLAVVGSPAHSGLEHSLHVRLSGVASRSAYSDPFIAALLVDPSLAGIFEFRGDDPNERTGIVYALTVIKPRFLTNGSSIAGQVAVLPGQLILMAAHQCLAANDLSEGRFVTEVLRALTEFRSLTDGESVQVPFYVGLSGVKLAANVEVPTPWGTIRNLREAEDHLFALGPVDVKTVLQGTVEVQVVPGDNDEAMAGRISASAQDAVDLMTRKASLALAFAVERDPPVGVAQSWSMIFAHVMSGGMTMPGFRSGLVAEHELTTIEADRFQNVASVIEARYCDQIDLAVRRCLSAIGKRSDPVDCLIDAMISLESITQQDISGVTFQLAASMAVLLGRTVEERESTFRQIKKLYDLRSKVVHGRGSLSHGTVVSSALDTAKLALRGLHSLFFDHPELLRSDQRGRGIVLGTSL